MSMSVLNATSTPNSSLLANQKAATARAADGDYKSPGAGHRIKDADGDYKPAPGPMASAPASVASTTQSALASLKLGG